MAKSEATKKRVDQVEAAREDLSRAEAAHAREAARVADARRELDRLADELRDIDPDEVTFGKLARERDAARARADALVEREEAARATAERVRRGLEEAERAARRARVEELDRQIRALDAAITGEVVGFYSHLLQRVGEARQLAAEASALDGSYADPARGSRWAAASQNRGAWKWAMGVLPEES